MLCVETLRATSLLKKVATPALKYWKKVAICYKEKLIKYLIIGLLSQKRKLCFWKAHDKWGKLRQHFAVMNGSLDINEGALAENFVADELVKKGYPLHYFDRKSKHELDFILPGEDGITILEVKSGGNFRKHASLDYALQHDSTMIANAIVLCNSNVATTDRIHYLPLYMAMFL